MESKRKLSTFIISFIIAFAYWRIYVFLFYNSGNISFLRELTGLSIHHSTYGLAILLIGVLLLLFYNENIVSVGITGFGIGSAFDSFVSGLLRTSESRAIEISTYNSAFLLTAFVFANIILFAIIIYSVGKNKSA